MVSDGLVSADLHGQPLPDQFVVKEVLSLDAAEDEPAVEEDVSILACLSHTGQERFERYGIRVAFGESQARRSATSSANSAKSAALRVPLHVRTVTETRPFSPAALPRSSDEEPQAISLLRESLARFQRPGGAFETSVAHSP